MLQRSGAGNYFESVSSPYDQLETGDRPVQRLLVTYIYCALKRYSDVVNAVAGMLVGPLRGEPGLTVKKNQIFFHN